MKLLYSDKDNNNYKPVPSGTYKAKVIKAEWAKFDSFVNDVNTEGVYLDLWIDTLNEKNQRKRAFLKVGLDHPKVLNNIRISAGLKSVKEGEDYDPSDLHGKYIYVDLRIIKSKISDKKFNVVDRYLKKSEFESLKDDNEEEVDDEVSELEDDDSNVEDPTTLF